MSKLSEREARYYVAARQVTFTLAPVLAAYITFITVQPKYEEPFDLILTRTVAAPPASVRVHEVDYRIDGNINPLVGKDSGYAELLRAEPARVARGAAIYFQECVLCHGANLSSRGMFAGAFRPAPSNLQSFLHVLRVWDVYLFWRVAKGSDVPPEGSPWLSAMPAMEAHLTTDEMWQVISFIYWFTQEPPGE